MIYQLFPNDYDACNGLGIVFAQQGKLAEAANLYEAIVHFNPNGSLGSEAGLRLMELKMKLQSASPATAPAAPFKPNH